MTLREKRCLFTRLLAAWITHVGSLDKGYELAIDQVMRPDRAGHMRNSLHYIGLAADLNLYVKGVYVSDGAHPAWQEIGQAWIKMDQLCRWGGNFNDSNHVSLAHEGRQ